MKDFTVVLIRHGQSSANVSHMLSGCMDVPENEYIPQEWTISAVNASAPATHSPDNNFLNKAVISLSPFRVKIALENTRENVALRFARRYFNK